MWDSINNDDCNNMCSYSNSANKIPRFERMQTEDLYMDKENMNLSPLKCEDLSLYGSNSPVPNHCANTSPTFIRRPLEDHDSNSQDSGYGASYGAENGKFLSHASPNDEFLSFDTGSLCSMEEDFMEEIPDLHELADTQNLPLDFSKLISGPLIPRHRGIDIENDSPKDNLLKPYTILRRSVSLQNSSGTPSSSRVRSCLFKGEIEIRNFKRPEPPTGNDSTMTIKRSKMFDDEEAVVAVPDVKRPILKRAFSATEESIMCAVQRSSTEPDLIGDFSKCFFLPLTNGKHQDMKAITSATLAKLIKGGFGENIASFKVIDCRYPYEFDGGHIEGAVNIYTKEGCTDLLRQCEAKVQETGKREILIFHCEFSSERGPNLYRHLRKEDRHKNESLYPSLNYPEMYLLEGGYKNFFEQFAEMCIPVAYKEMLHPDHGSDLRHFRQKSKTWNIDSRHRPKGHLKRLF